MTRRGYGAAFWLVLLAALLPGRGVTSSPLDDRPNVIIFHPDDLPWLPQWPEGPAANQAEQLSFFPREVPTPNIDRIRAEGVVNANAHTTTPICAGSRFATITSRLNSRGLNAREDSLSIPLANETGRVDVVVPYTRLSGNDLNETFPHDMRAAGYFTGMSGKWHLLPLTEESKFGDYEGSVEKVKAAGFDWAGGLYEHNIVGPGNRDCITQACRNFSHNLEWMTAEAKGFIDEAQEVGQPFMLYFNPTTPNVPDVVEAFFDYSVLDTPAGRLSEVPDSGMPSREDMWETAKQVLTEEEIAMAESGNYTGSDCRSSDGKAPGCGGAHAITPQKASTALGIVYTDAALGALVAHLERRGILDNTLILVQMDHGSDTKNRVFNGGTQVMSTWRYPSLGEPGSIVEAPISNLDIGPTFLQLAGGKPKYVVDGLSWVPLLTGDDDGKSRRGAIFSEIQFERAAVSPEGLAYISRGDLSSTSAHVLDRLEGSAAAEQLYDLTKDQAQLNNLIDDPSYADAAADLRKRIECLDRELGLFAPEYRNNSILETCMKPKDDASTPRSQTPGGSFDRDDDSSAWTMASKTSAIAVSLGAVLLVSVMQ